MRTSHFSAFFCLYDLENRVMVTKIYTILFSLQIIHISMFNLNQLNPSGNLCKQGIFQHSLTSRDRENEVKVNII